MIRSGYVKFLLQNKTSSTYLVSRGGGETDFTPTTQELESILSRVKSILINAFGSANVVVKWLRGNVGTSGNGDYSSPFKTIQDAQNWAASNNKRVILLWHSQDNTPFFTFTGNPNLDRIYLLGGKWDGNQRVVSTDKVTIMGLISPSSYIDKIGCLVNTIYDIHAPSIFDNDPPPAYPNWTTRISTLDPTWWDGMYLRVIASRVYTRAMFHGLDKNGRYYRLVYLCLSQPI
ncbi:MAG: hypothetical protein ABDH28_05750 [Brevinematia bacterium]